MWPFSSSPESSSSSPTAPLQEPLLSESLVRCKVVILGDTGVGKTSLAVRFVRDAFRKFETTTGGGFDRLLVRGLFLSEAEGGSAAAIIALGRTKFHRTYLTQKLRLENLTVDATDAVTHGDIITTTTITRTVKFNIWDTAGHLRARPTAPLYYKGAAAAIVVYDVTNPASLETAMSWIDELSENNNTDTDIDRNRDEDDEETNENSNSSNSSSSIVLALVGNKIDLAEDRTVAFEEADAYALERGLLHLGTSAKTAWNVRGLFIELARAIPFPDEPEGDSNDDNGGEDKGENDEVERSCASVARSALCCLRRRNRAGDEQANRIGR